MPIALAVPEMVWPIDSSRRALRDTMIDHANFFADIDASFPHELSTTLLDVPKVRIERIVSHGHASPHDFWYDQEQNEWVIVLKGAARLRFEDGTVEMKPGDFLNIPAHKRHRVEWTIPGEATIWLAIFYE